MIIAAGLVVAVTGCSGSSSAPPAGRTTAPVSESANGSTIRVAAGAAVRVTLHSTYWQFAPDSSPDVLRRTAIVTQPDTGAPHIPGSGRGTVVAVFVAVARGTASIAASRTSCGEALRCVGSQGSFRLTVVVG